MPLRYRCKGIELWVIWGISRAIIIEIVVGIIAPLVLCKTLVVSVLVRGESWLRQLSGIPAGCAALSMQRRPTEKTNALFDDFKRGILHLLLRNRTFQFSRPSMQNGTACLD